MAQFADILDRAPTEVEKPKTMPVGSYTCLVKGLPRFDVSEKKKTPFVEFTLQFLSPHDDVDQDDLRAALTKKTGETVPLNAKTIRNTFYLTEDALFRLNTFLEHLGFDIDDAESNLRQMCNEAQGKQVGVQIKHGASEDGETVYANIARTFSVE